MWIARYHATEPNFRFGSWGKNFIKPFLNLPNHRQAQSYSKLYADANKASQSNSYGRTSSSAKYCWAILMWAMSSVGATETCPICITMHIYRPRILLWGGAEKMCFFPLLRDLFNILCGKTHFKYDNYHGRLFYLLHRLWRVWRGSLKCFHIARCFVLLWINKLKRGKPIAIRGWLILQTVAYWGFFTAKFLKWWLLGKLQSKLGQVW